MATTRFHERFDPVVAEVVARRLQAYATDLPEREQAIILALLYVTLPPLERMALLAADDVLTAQEQEVLHQLRREGS